MTKRTKKEAFEIMLWAMISDCGNDKRYWEFKRTLAHAADVLSGMSDVNAKKGRKK